MSKIEDSQLLYFLSINNVLSAFEILKTFNLWNPLEFLFLVKLGSQNSLTSISVLLLPRKPAEPAGPCMTQSPQEVYLEAVKIKQKQGYTSVPR